MPFGEVHTPSLAISLLQAELAQVSIPACACYPNLDFAERIGVERYDRYWRDLSGASLGEWIFSDCLFPRPERESERYVEDVLIPLQRFTLEDIAGFEKDRALARPFLEDCLRSRDWGRYRAVGFTTTFQQNTASLALARMLKEAYPGITIIFGGANCEGVMGEQLLKCFPWIDVVCAGEGDDAVPELALQLAGRRPVQPIAGILRRSREAEIPALTRPPMVTDLDRLPFPEFSGYFDRVRNSPVRADLRCRITLETSRGCWWGEKHHCTFCGLNGMTMRFRSKAPDRAQREIAQLAAEYKPLLNPRCGISFSDNILDMNYFRSLLPALREAGLGTKLFYETKANLTREQVRLLAESGIREIQPGIESLHTDLLKLMRKGCTRLQNIQLLKWCRRYGITAQWNLLFGFPGEEPRWFDEQARLIPRILHLRPPDTVSPVRLDRFSPYFCEAEAHGIHNVRPQRALSYIYPLPEAELHGIAYHFDFDYADGRDPSSYIRPLMEAVREWRLLVNDSFLYALPWRGRLVVWDERGGGARRHRLMSPAEGGLYEFCDRVRSGPEIQRFAGETLGMSETEVHACLADWAEAGILITEDDRHLALAVLVDDEVKTYEPDPANEAGSRPDSAAHRAGPAAHPLRRPGMRSLALPEGTFVLDRTEGRAFVLEGVAAELWAHSDGRRPVAAVVNEISARNGAHSESDARELDRVFGSLVAEGLIQLHPDSSGT